MDLYQRHQPVFVSSAGDADAAQRIVDILITWYATDLIYPPPAGAELLAPGETKLYNATRNSENKWELTFIGRHPQKDLYYQKTIIAGDAETTDHLAYTTDEYVYHVTGERPIEGETGVWLKSGGVTISSAMKMTGATIASGQSQRVYNYGSALYTVVESGGTATVYSGGELSSCADNWRVFVSGGLADSVTVGDGAQGNAYVGGTMTNLVVSAGGRFTVQSGAVLSGCTRLDGATYCYILGGGTGYDIHNYYGRFEVSAGGYVSGMHQYAGNATIGGTATDVIVSSGASLTVSSGGTALAVTSNAGATVKVLEGGYIEYTNQ